MGGESAPPPSSARVKGTCATVGTLEINLLLYLTIASAAVDFILFVRNTLENGKAACGLSMGFQKAKSHLDMEVGVITFLALVNR